jgi:tRNA 2-thiouridine synthesizing protein A
MLSHMGERFIDAQFQKSPLPVLRAARVLRGMAPGEKLRILATDPAALADFLDFCKQTGHALIARSESRGVYSFSVKRKADAP